MKLLLHSCCAPCTVQCAAALLEENITPDLFWYNPNIHPYIEYCSRRDTLRQYAREAGLGLVPEDEYGLRVFLEGLYNPPARENGPSAADSSPARCAFCYRLRLEKTAARAASEGYDAFSSTLLISPYQNHELIKATAETLAARYGTAFLYRDFRPRFRAGQQEARARGFYMQKYCGCIFSEEERYRKQRV
ncbi:MAG: epoxyqueuosine reductase QueH [Spirochaetaceae bacterium]|nr:epoxyqueuosine reductase QueH [Spirochaetaceae bacterium]